MKSISVVFLLLITLGIVVAVLSTNNFEIEIPHGHTSNSGVAAPHGKSEKDNDRKRLSTEAPVMNADEQEVREQDKTEKVTKAQQKQHKKDRQHSKVQNDGAELMKQFLSDPSFPVRCKGSPIPLNNCPKAQRDPENDGKPWFKTKEIGELPLMQPHSHGSTTEGMVVSKSTKEVHHPVFSLFTQQAYHDDWIDGRIVEFNGVHTNYSYDCEAKVDFHMYHQVRAAMCQRYDKLVSAKETDVTDGMWPLLDEEYFEYAMTLATANSAAKNNRPYVFIELGARYGTWIVRAGASYKMMGGKSGQLKLLGVEGNCEWFWKMREHVECNGLGEVTEFVLAYAAPRSYNKVNIAQQQTYKEPRAISMLDMLPQYTFVDMIDFDIQGFEYFTVAEPGVMKLLTEKVGFIHFGTHSTDIEKNLLDIFQKNDEWCVVYFFAGAHTKKLHKGHFCKLPYGMCGFNDGVMGLANKRFYQQFKGNCRSVPHGRIKNVAKTCTYISEALNLMEIKDTTSGKGPGKEKQEKLEGEQQ